MPQPLQPAWSASLLRRDLNARAHHLARTQNLLHDIHPASSPIVIFGRDEQGRHGNFHPASNAAICANPAWLRRLAKPHTASRRSRARKDWQWMELDSANSSDALLMNIFCHPGVFNGQTLNPAVANLLSVDPIAQPCFGINPGVPLKSIRKRSPAKKPKTGLNDQTLTDRTEIDLQLGNLFLEAKLTESNFQTATLRLIERYRDLETVFDITRLPTKILYPPIFHPPAEDESQLEDELEIGPDGSEPADLDPGTLREAKNPSSLSRPLRISIQPKTTATTPQAFTTSPSRTLIQGYQLIRNVLAAYASDAAFCVLCDARRRDLIDIWYSVLSAVHSPTFATRLKLLTWQELAATLPDDLQRFLDVKYGISPT